MRPFTLLSGKLYLIVLLLILVLFFGPAAVRSDVFFASPDSDAEQVNVSLCTNLAHPCTLEAILLQNATEMGPMEVRLMPGTDGNAYNETIHTVIQDISLFADSDATFGSFFNIQFDYQHVDAPSPSNIKIDGFNFHGGRFSNVFQVFAGLSFPFSISISRIYGKGVGDLLHFFSQNGFNTELHFEDILIEETESLGHIFTIEYTNFQPSTMISFNNVTVNQARTSLFRLMSQDNMVNAHVTFTDVSFQSDPDNPPLKPILDVDVPAVKELSFSNVNITSYGSECAKIHISHAEAIQFLDSMFTSLGKGVALTAYNIRNFNLFDSVLKGEDGALSIQFVQKEKPLTTYYQLSFKMENMLIQSKTSSRAVSIDWQKSDIDMIATDCDFIGQVHLFSRYAIYATATGSRFLDTQNAISSFKVDAPYGKFVATDNLFNNTMRGLTAYFSDKTDGEAIVERNRFENIYFNAPEGAHFDFENKIGGAAFVFAAEVMIRNNSFIRNTFISADFDERDAREARKGTLGVWGNEISEIYILDNHFENCTADVGAGITLWADMMTASRPLVIKGNTVQNSVAFEGAGVAVFNNLILSGLQIVDNYFYNNAPHYTGIIYIQTFVQTEDITISRNTFVENHSNHGSSGTIDFSFGVILNLTMEGNSFYDNSLDSNIHGVITQIEASIQNSLFGCLGHQKDSRVSSHINIYTEDILTFNLLDTVMSTDDKQLLKAVVGSECDKIFIRNASALSVGDREHGDFITISCGKILSMALKDITSFYPIQLEQTSGTSIGGLVSLSNIKLTGGRGNPNLLLLSKVNAYIEDSIFQTENPRRSSLVYCKDSQTHVKNTTIRGGEASVGACIHSLNGKLTLESSLFEHCMSFNGGGGIYTEVLDLLNITNSVIRNMKSFQKGGALFSVHSQFIYIDQSRFESSTSAVEGGCAFLSKFHKIHMTDTYFSDCASDSVGGGLLLDTGLKNETFKDEYFDNLHFHNCESSDAGGGVWAEQFYPTLHDTIQAKRTTFTSCTSKFTDGIGSPPKRILVNHRLTDTHAHQPFFSPNKIWQYKIVASIETLYPGQNLRPHPNTMLIKRTSDNHTRAPQCQNSLTEEEREIYYCFIYEYKYKRMEQTIPFLLSYEKRFRANHKNVTKPVYFHIPSLVLSVLLLFGLVGILAIVIVLSLSHLGVCFGSLFVRIWLEGKKASRADMELSLLKYRFEQENLLDEEGNRAKVTLNNELFEISFSDVTLQEKIGSGGSGSLVWKGLWKGQSVALKLFKTSFMTDEVFLADFEHEATLMASLHHPNIIRFYGAILDPPRCGIVTEYYPSSLAKLIKSGKSRDMTWPQKLSLLNQTAQAMEFLVEKNIIHRDLKPDNVLLSENGRIALTDFGLSRLMSDSKGMTSRIGTSYYIAPEVVTGQEYDWRCDVFSFGMMIYELGLTDQPLEETFGSVPGIEYKIANDPNFRPDMKDITITCETAFLVVLMRQCWDHDPAKRPSFSEIRSIFEEEIQKLDSEEAKVDMHCTCDGKIYIGDEAKKYENGEPSDDSAKTDE